MKVDKLRLLILHDLDMALDIGFEEMIKNTIQRIEPKTQVVIFTSTSTISLDKFVDELVSNSVKVTVKKEVANTDIVKHYTVNVDNEDVKFAVVLDILQRSEYKMSQCVIICNSKKVVEWLCEKFKEQNITAVGLHGSMEQSKRSAYIEEFLSKSATVLVLTNVCLRGSKVQEIPIIMNYELSETSQDYFNRLSCLSKKGASVINIITPKEIKLIKEIEVSGNIQFLEMRDD